MVNQISVFISEVEPLFQANGIYNITKKIHVFKFYDLLQQEFTFEYTSEFSYMVTHQSIITRVVFRSLKDYNESFKIESFVEIESVIRYASELNQYANAFANAIISNFKGELTTKFNKSYFSPYDNDKVKYAKHLFDVAKHSKMCDDTGCHPSCNRRWIYNKFSMYINQ